MPFHVISIIPAAASGISQQFPAGRLSRQALFRRMRHVWIEVAGRAARFMMAAALGIVVLVTLPGQRKLFALWCMLILMSALSMSLRSRI